MFERGGGVEGEGGDEVGWGKERRQVSRESKGQIVQE